MARKSRWRSRFIMLSLLMAAVLLYGFSRVQDFARAPLGLPNTALVTVEAGDGLNRVLPKLRAAGIATGWDWQWKLLAMRMDMAGRIHVGDYEFKPEMSPRAVLAMLASGDTARHKYTLVEGRNFRQVRQELALIPGLQDDLKAKSNAEIMALLGRPGMHPEGRFLPDTYFIPKSGKASDFLAQALPAMDKALNDAWAKRKTGLPIKTSEELLILASIVEKETGLSAERAQVAGVFVQRLKIGMRLETDPTVIYGLGEAYDGNIRKKDLQTKTPYNTYRMHGLPPTPIAMPGRAALLASAQPAEGEALFFVANDRGEHVFSKTYAEHKKAVAAFQLKKNQ
jgi:UPF0755 protein